MKSMKKLVLVGLVLLASVMVLLPLVGCKNDSVPEVPKFTVTFDKNAADATGEMAPQTFTQGEKKELTANAFVRPTWTFSGWSENKDATTPEYKDKAEFTTSKDTTLYAVWTDNGTVSPVTFSPSSTKLYYGETVALSTTTKDATIKYRLADSENWKTYNEAISITSDTTITAYATKAGLKDSKETSATYTVRKLTSITVTPPSRTVYSVGESFDSTVVLTATYDDGEERNVTGTIDSDTSSLTETAGVKEITVKYSEGGVEKSLTLKVGVIGEATYEFTETPQRLSNYSSSSAPTGTWTYVEFGDWPQTKKSDDVMVNTKIALTRGGLDFFVGTDGNYYVKHNDSYYKVEPIVWRVLNKDYASTGQALLLAEKILTGGIPYYVNTSSRTIGSATVYANNYKYSTIRAWLNGSYETEDTQETNYEGKGFLQTAFTEEAQKLIESTKVDNSARSTNPNSDASKWNSGNNEYACENTSDKIFLLSEQEATTAGYGFVEYNEYGEGNTRIRVTTDYAKATGAYHSSTAGYGGWWWLRSPLCDYEYFARNIYDDGDALLSDDVDDIEVGVVPALSISMNGN